MELRFLKVSVCGHGHPRISFNGDWLALAGFEIDTLVMAEFFMGEAVFSLCDTDAGSAYDLICKAKGDGRRLLRVSSCLSKGKCRPIFRIEDVWLPDFGFPIGAHMAIMISYGSIRAKVIDKNIFLTG